MANEKRLIDVNKVIGAMQKCLDESPEQKGSVAYFAFESIIAALKQEPTVDATEVVRCKDCKHYSDSPYENGDMMCDRWDEWIFPNDDDFCSCGERKDNG